MFKGGENETVCPLRGGSALVAVGPAVWNNRIKGEAAINIAQCNANVPCKDGLSVAFRGSSNFRGVAWVPDCGSNSCRWPGGLRATWREVSSPPGCRHGAFHGVYALVGYAHLLVAGNVSILVCCIGYMFFETRAISACDQDAAGVVVDVDGWSVSCVSEVRERGG